MQDHALDTERVGDETGMLPARTAKTVEHIASDVIAPLHGNRLDSVGHIGDGDLDEAFGDLLRQAAIAQLPRERMEGLHHRAPVQQLVLAAPENLGKQIGLELARHDIGVRDRERPALAIGDAGPDRHPPSPVPPGNAPRRNEGSNLRPPRLCV